MNNAFHSLQKLLASVFVSVMLCSCAQTDSEISLMSFPDSVVNEQLRYMENLEEPDTSNQAYKVLKAYATDDTAYFKTLSEEINSEKQNLAAVPKEDCPLEPKLHTLNVDEAYRFEYRTAFCPSKMIFTITARADSFKLRFIVYQRDSDTIGCRIVRKHEKNLTGKDWINFKNSLDEADFWGLKRENGINGLDGSDLKVWGMITAGRKYESSTSHHYVHRWLMRESALSNCFSLLKKLSGNDQPCIWGE